MLSCAINLLYMLTVFQMEEMNVLLYMCDMSSMGLAAVKFPLIYERNIHL